MRKRNRKLAQNNHKFMMKVQLNRRHIFQDWGMKNEKFNDDELFPKFLWIKIIQVYIKLYIWKVFHQHIQKVFFYKIAKSDKENCHN